MLAAPSVGIDATIHDARQLGSGDLPVAVVSVAGVLLGALQPSAFALADETPVEQVMISAPGTIRPDKRVEEALEQVSKDGLDHVYVTTVSGILVGLVIPGEVHV